VPNKWTFWIYIDGINQTKGPFVMFMGHIGVLTKEARQRLGMNYIFILRFVSCLQGLIKGSSLCLWRCYPQIIASFAFTYPREVKVFSAYALFFRRPNPPPVTYFVHDVAATVSYDRKEFLDIRTAIYSPRIGLIIFLY
jgi:hypothetical protein